MNYRLILASKSPRRQSLLKALELEFEVRTKSVDEDYPSSISPSKVAEFLARQKSAAYELNEDELLITSDTTVLFKNEIIGKPKNRIEAISILERLSGQEHQVVTGVCLRNSLKTVSFSETTAVTFGVLSSIDIQRYVDKHQPYDKAGSYGIQEWIGMIGISKIEGDYYNVMGLPLYSLRKKLSEFQ